VVYAGDELHQVAVLSIGGLPWAGKRFRLLLAVQESREEGGGVAALTQGGGEAPGGTGGIAVVVKIEVALTNCWKAGEAIDGTGGQGGGAAALAGATGVSGSITFPARRLQDQPHGAIKKDREMRFCILAGARTSLLGRKFTRQGGHHVGEQCAAISSAELSTQNSPCNLSSKTLTPSIHLQPKAARSARPALRAKRGSDPEGWQ
jgi:hypothetical protein